MHTYIHLDCNMCFEGNKESALFENDWEKGMT